jgi:hypothetical protein
MPKKSRLGNDSDARVVLKNLLTISVDGAYLDAMSGTTLQKKFTYKLELNFGVKGKAT